MKIESPKINQTNNTKQQNSTQQNSNSSIKFTDELKELEKSKESTLETNQAEVEEVEEIAAEEDIQNIQNTQNVQKNQEVHEVQKSENIPEENVQKDFSKKNINNKILDESHPLVEPNQEVDTQELEPKIDLQEKLNELNTIVKELNQSDDKPAVTLKDINKTDDNTEKGDDLINNDFNIKDNKDILPQMNPNMNFSGDGQPFSSFMGNDENNQQDSNKVLKSTSAELAEEKAILSSMDENIAIANKNKIIKQAESIEKPSVKQTYQTENKQTEVPVEKTVNREEGIKKIDIKSGITIETVVKYDSIIMNEADVEVFTTLVEKGEVNLNNLAPQAAEKSSQVSKTLADMLAKTKETNQPLRIDFDNGISVIIKITRDGKVSADFLPSAQVAETYLKENLPILRQRFDEKNLDYEQLNQRERKGQNREDNRKKGRQDE